MRRGESPYIVSTLTLMKFIIFIQNNDHEKTLLNPRAFGFFKCFYPDRLLRRF